MKIPSWVTDMPDRYLTAASVWFRVGEQLLLLWTEVEGV